MISSIGNRILYLLKENNMTRYKLAKITCLSEKTLSDIIHGKTKDINLSSLYLISSAFNMDILEFLAPDDFRNDKIEV